MTGAPKLRSCQILQSLKSGPRGIYSGVFGYLDVDGGGEFCVIIRSAFKWDNNHRRPSSAHDPADYETRKIGVGGAITALSTEHGEYEEMMPKLNSTLCLFKNGQSTSEQARKGDK